VAALAVLLVSMLVISWPGLRGALWAQLPPPNPLVVPPAAPSPPTQLSPPVPPQGLPSLAVIPSPAASASPVSISRIFNCSCFGPANPTHWMGRVTAPSYFGARQAAVSACLGYNTNKAPVSPFMPPRTSDAFAPVPGMPSGSNAVDAAPNIASARPGTLNFSTAQQLQMCSQCTCD